MYLAPMNDISNVASKQLILTNEMGLSELNIAVSVEKRALSC